MKGAIGVAAEGATIGYAYLLKIIERRIMKRLSYVGGGAD